MAFSIESILNCRTARKQAVCTVAAFCLCMAVAAPPAAQAQDAVLQHFVGEIFATAASYCPKGTEEAVGQQKSKEHELILHSVYQARYGDEGNTFGLPDLRGPFQRQGIVVGETRWCVAFEGVYSQRNGFDEGLGANGELMAFGASGGWCPGGYQLQTDPTLPHRETVSWCKYEHWSEPEDYLAQMLLIAGDSCPRYAVPADGKLLQIEENTSLFSLLGASYGGDGQTTFSLPNPSSPSQGTRWCIVTSGYFPAR